MTQEQIEFSERYAYRDIDEYAAILGVQVNDSHKIIWNMARVKNKHLGIFQPYETNESKESA